MQPAVFERTSYYTSLFQKVKPFFHIFVCFLCGEGVTFRRSSPDSRLSLIHISEPTRRVVI